MSVKKWGLHWFRRDLRIPGNPALKENWRQTQGRTLGLFCFDSKFLSRPDFSHNRFAFFLETLRELKKDLQAQGGDLLVIDCLPDEAFQKLIQYLDQNGLPRPSLVTWNRDYEPFARQRDQTIEDRLQSLQISTIQCRDHLLFEPHEVLKSEKLDDFYQVYSPYARKWFDRLHSEEGQKRLALQANAFEYYKRRSEHPEIFHMTWEELKKSDFPWEDQLEHFSQKNSEKVTIPIPKAGFYQAFEDLLSFKEKLEAYKENRDFPFLKATSRLSIYLKNGSLTTAQIISTLNLGKASWKEKSGPAHFVKELAWREFYYAILFHRPDVEKKSFLSQYEDLPWENNETLFERWKNGTTGFPIVDAGMRELNTTGWMHNRVRMIVASFLTKDLLIDWRWGENYFMQKLLDGDLAPNNGGWQWAASTGCDPQPYFRIFNPWLQSAKFDPDGVYIKKHIPELRSTPSEDLHDVEADLTRYGYPAPMVDHYQRRDQALALYKAKNQKLE